ncbi:hypothetical protein BD779DRAFT_1667154 [Infundibulicybe gibba]|nr:hypothetical protein BD779DRAFT_1667154 [Infundibulicybe gibba]
MGDLSQPPGLLRSPSPDRNEESRSGLAKIILPLPNEMDELGQVLFDGKTPGTTHFRSIAFVVKGIQQEHQLSFAQVVDFAKCLFKILVDHRGATQSLFHLIDYYVQLTVTDASPRLRELEVVWRLVGAFVLFPLMGLPSGMAAGLMHAFHLIFPQANACFTITDLVKTKFDIISIEFPSEHLVLEGNTVKIFKISQISDVALVTYDQNGVARGLQISSLGNEVLAPLSTLVNDHGLQEQAEKLGVIYYDAKDEGGRAVVDMLLMGDFSLRRSSTPNMSPADLYTFR